MPRQPHCGDKVLSKGTRHVVNRAAMALRIAATTLLRSSLPAAGMGFR